MSAHPIDEDTAPGGRILQSEWSRVARLCARLTGDIAAAEDLAQETMLVAWRHAHELRDPAARPAWLAGIARRRCADWVRRRGRERGRLIDVRGGDAGVALPFVEDLPGGDDLELALERDELAALLDRALALLPPDTRQALIQRYVDGLPQAEVAARLGVSEGAVAVRLHRGKVALRRVLATNLADESAAYGLAEDNAGEQETRIWCTTCGARRLHGRLDPALGELLLRCPGCDTRPGVSYAYAREEDFFDSVKGYKPALNRLSRWLSAYWATRAGGAIPCARCGQPTAWRSGPDADEPGGAHAAWIECRACRRRVHSALSGLALGRPDAQRFWRDNPRIRLLPERAVEAAGRDALVTGFQSVTGAATLTVIAARDTYEVIAVHGASER